MKLSISTLAFLFLIMFLGTLANRNLLSNFNFVFNNEKVDQIETIIGFISSDELNDYYSTSFYKYSKNLYYAKKGYKFKDSNLSIFFENQKWYKINPNQEIKFNPSEKKCIEQISLYEQNPDSVEYRKIIYSFIFNGFPLYYIAWNPQVINNQKDEFFDAGFALLDSTMLWTLKCKTIPPEYIISKSIKFIPLMNEMSHLRLDQIVFTNIDKGCIGGDYEEIVLHLEGSSDYRNDIILGFNSKGEFDTLFNKDAIIGSINKLNDSTMQFNITYRCDYIGTMVCDAECTYNTITKNVTDIPVDFDSVSTISETLEELILYTSPESAIEERKDSIVGVLPVNAEVEVIKYFEEEGVYYIKNSKISGWINEANLQKLNISFAG